MRYLGVFGLMLVMCASVFAQSLDSIDSFGSHSHSSEHPSSRSSSKKVVETSKSDSSDERRIIEAREKFHRAVIKSAVKARKAGKISRADVVRLRVAMMSPAFRKHAEDMAVIQMSASGSDAVPVGDDGRVDRSKIDWDALLAFIEKLIPLILQLIDALSMAGIDGDLRVVVLALPSCDGVPFGAMFALV